MDLCWETNTNKETHGKRIGYIDFYRGVAIFLVVFGHCIQLGNGSVYYNSASFYSDTIYQFIYSFHMPLLMMISGVMMRESQNKHQYKIKDILIRSIKKYIVPILIVWMIKIPYFIYQGSNNLLFDFYNTMWFLWALFFCSNIVSILDELFDRYKVLLWLIIGIAVFLFPDIAKFGLYKYVFLYYALGYYFGGWIKNKTSFKPFFVIVLICIFLALLTFYDESSFIYVTGISISGCSMNEAFLQIKIDVFRYFIGVIGSINCICICSIIYQKGITIINDCFELLGRESLWIYIISTEFLNLFLKQISNAHEFYLANIVQSILIIILSIWIGICLKRLSFSLKTKFNFV